MIKPVWICAAVAAAASLVGAQPPARKAPMSPPAETSVAIAGQTLSIHYSAPSMRGRKIFGEGGLVSHEKNYPVWRAGANNATAFHTDADLDMQGLAVPKGDYTLFVNVGDPDHWELIINKQTKQWGLTYKKDMDLGRVKTEMSKPAAPIETFKMTLSSAGDHSGKLQLEWENHVAAVNFTAK